jgi:hypothetical protein
MLPEMLFFVNQGVSARLTTKQNHYSMMYQQREQGDESMQTPPVQSTPDRLDGFVESNWTVLAACTFIVGLDFVLFRKSLGLYFIQDDFHYLWVTSDQSLWGFASIFAMYDTFYRPISNHLYFFILQGIFGTNPFPYHLCNLLIHIVNSLAVGYLVYLTSRNRRLAFASAVIFTSRVGHVISIYWICVTTQSMPLLFFLLSLIAYIHYRDNRRPWVLAISYFLFALCVFSNINGPTLVVLITAYDVLVRRDRSFLAMARRESGFYLIVCIFLILQFMVFGWQSADEYEAGFDSSLIGIFGGLNVYAFNVLYLLDYYRSYPPIAVWAEVAAGLGMIGAAAVGFVDCMRHRLPDEAGNYAFYGFWYIVGCVPYMLLGNHTRLPDRVWPQYITVAAVGVAFLSAWLLLRSLKTRGTLAALCLLLVIAFVAVRTFEKEEYETKGAIYKSDLARNIITDLTGYLESDDHIERIYIINGKVEVWWILHYGRNAEVFLGKFRPIFYPTSPEEIPSDPASLVLRYDNMHLHRVR